MPSQVIPESIAGNDLLAPDAYNFFSIESGGLPNGDDCLVIHGDVDNDYKAFINSPALTPDLFREYAGVHIAPYAISFWIKAPAFTGTSMAVDRALFGVCKATGEPQAAAHGANALWTVGIAGSGNVFYCRGYQSGASSYIIYIEAVGVRDGTWHFVCFNAGTSNGTTPNLNGEAFVDDGTTPTASDTSVNGSGAFPDPSDLYFSLGTYSDTATSFNQEWRLGKLTFHDHHLNATERAALYNAMVA